MSLDALPGLGWAAAVGLEPVSVFGPGRVVALVSELGWLDRPSGIWAPGCLRSARAGSGWLPACLGVLVGVGSFAGPAG
jgi:hypothetical protein